MILIAESGSTKTDWIILKGDEKIHHQSPGINPFYQDSESIYESIKFLSEIGQVEKIFFYGAGCANSEKNKIVEDALKLVFPSATCEINSDLLAASRSLCGKEEGIVCILGTGSNSCFYDGFKIKHKTSSLGFILGDEGSGAVLGKKLVSDILKKQAPKEIVDSFYKAYKLTEADIVHRVYREEFPNRFLAQFTVFMSKNLSNKYMSNLIKESFIEFFERNIKQYNNKTKLPIHFTGSIAFHFTKELEIAANQTGFSIGKILKSPLEGLIKFHLRY